MEAQIDLSRINQAISKAIEGSRIKQVKVKSKGVSHELYT